MKVVEDVCIRCHQSQREAGTRAMLSTTAEFLQSTAYGEGKTCVDCHMRAPDDNTSHRFEGSRTAPGAYQGTVAVEGVEQREGKIVVVIRNKISGHYLPTGAPENVLFLEVTGYDDRGEVVYHKEVRFEKDALWFRTMPMMVRSDNRLKDDERREIAFSASLGLRKIKAALAIRPTLWNGEVVQAIVDEKVVESNRRQ